jgi:hypothetical protein
VVHSAKADTRMKGRLKNYEHRKLNIKLDQKKSCLATKEKYRLIDHN